MLFSHPPRLRSLITRRVFACPAALLIALGLTACKPGGTTDGAAAQARQVEVGEQAITLRTTAGRIEVDRKPFRMRFFNSRNELVLAQAADGTALPQPGLTLDEPLGSDYVPDRLLHAPFSFLVGVQASPQLRATPWVGN